MGIKVILELEDVEELIELANSVCDIHPTYRAALDRINTAINTELRLKEFYRMVGI